MKLVKSACAVVLLTVAMHCVWPLASQSIRRPTHIVRLDPRLDALLPAGAQLERIADGFEWVEGPLWNRREGYLLFSDIPRNSVMRWRPALGISLYLSPSGYTGDQPFTGREPGSNGLTFDLQGRLILAAHGDRRIVRVESDGKRVTLVDRYEGKRLNSPNDVLVDSKGTLYFTDPFFGLPLGERDPRKELAYNGVYTLAMNGKLRLLTRELPFPNGIALAPDERTLYVSNADMTKPLWMAFTVKNDGTLAEGRVFYDGTRLLGNGKGSADGMKVDRNGNIFAAGPGGIHIFAPDGTLLGSILTGVATSNCAWGGDGSDLYVTADTAVYRIRTTTKGHGF